MLGETEARTKAVSPRGVNSSSPAAQLRAPPWESPGWKGVGWNSAPEMGGEHCKLWRHNVPHGQIVAIRGYVGWGLLGRLGASPESGPTVHGCLCSRGCPTGTKEGKCPVPVAQGSGSQSFRSAQVSHSTGVSLQGAWQGDTYTDPVPTADSRGTPSPAPCPHPRVPRHPSPRQQEMAPGQPRSGRARRGQRLTGGRQPRLSGVLSPGNFPRLAGFWILARQSPTPSPCLPPAEEERPPAASAPGASENRPGRRGPARTGQGPPAHRGNCGSLTDGHPRMAPAVSHPPHPRWQLQSPGSTNPRWGLLPSPSIPNSGTNLPLHRARNW